MRVIIWKQQRKANGNRFNRHHANQPLLHLPTNLQLFLYNFLDRSDTLSSYQDYPGDRGQNAWPIAEAGIQWGGIWNTGQGILEFQTAMKWKLLSYNFGKTCNCALNMIDKLLSVFTWRRSDLRWTCRRRWLRNCVGCGGRVSCWSWMDVSHWALIWVFWSQWSCSLNRRVLRSWSLQKMAWGAHKSLTITTGSKRGHCGLRWFE